MSSSDNVLPDTGSQWEAPPGPELQTATTPLTPQSYDAQSWTDASWYSGSSELHTAVQAPVTPQSYDAQSWTDASWYDGSFQATTAAPLTSPSCDAQACTAVSWGAVSPELQEVTQATTAVSWAAASWDAGSQASAPDVNQAWPAEWGTTQPPWQATCDASSPQTDDSQGTVTSVDEPARKCARIDDSQPPPPPPPPPQATDPASAPSTNQHKGGGWKIKALHLAYVVLHGESSAIQDGASAHKLAKRMSADTRIADDWRRLSASCRNAH